MKNLPEGFVHFLETAWIPLVEVGLGLIIGPWVKRIIVRMARKSSDKGLMTFLGSAANMVIIVIAIIMAAEDLGVKMNSVLALISALGLGVALALKGNMANVAGGIQILITKPFKVGDYIQVSSHKGLVTAIELMFTTIRTDNGKEAVVPNSDMVEDLIVNYSKYPSIRIKAPFSLPVGHDYLKIKNEILEMMKVNPYFDRTKPVDVVFTALTNSNVTMEVVGYVQVESMEECKHLIYQDLASGLNYFQHGSTSEEEIKLVKSFDAPASKQPDCTSPEDCTSKAAVAFDADKPVQTSVQPSAPAPETGLEKLKQFEHRLKEDFSQTFDPIFHLKNNPAETSGPSSSGTSVSSPESVSSNTLPDSEALANPNPLDLNDSITPPSPVPAAPAGGYIPVQVPVSPTDDLASTGQSIQGELDSETEASLASKPGQPDSKAASKPARESRAFQSTDSPAARSANLTKDADAGSGSDSKASSALKQNTDAAAKASTNSQNGQENPAAPSTVLSNSSSNSNSDNT